MNDPQFSSSNPYQAPIEPGEFSPTSTAGISHGVLEALRLTRPWVLFLGVLGFIGTGFMVLAGVVLMVVGMAGGAPMGVAGGLTLGIVYLFASVLYIMPALYLVRYAGRIRTLLLNPTMTELESALDAQKSFWKFVGVVILVVFGLYVGIFLLGAVFALFA